MEATVINARSMIVALLEEKAHAGDLRAFTALAEAINWAMRRPDELTAAIDLALRLDAVVLARDLAQVGSRVFPRDERVRQAAYVLRRPQPGVSHAPPAKGLDATLAWVWDHASEYRGKWIAVREGGLLGVATTLKDLQALIAEDPISTFVHKVL